MMAKLTATARLKCIPFPGTYHLLARRAGIPLELRKGAMIARITVTPRKAGRRQGARKAR